MVVGGIYILLVLLYKVAFVYSIDENSAFHWHAPFFSGGGYSQEAFDMVLSLQSANLPVQLYQHGDGYNDVYVSQMLSGQDRDYLLNLKRPVHRSKQLIQINICHAEPGAWSAPSPKYYTESMCPPNNPSPNSFAFSNQRNPNEVNAGGFIMNNVGRSYNIGRTMFETDTIPSGWPDRLNYMDEIWVPTKFAEDIFIKAGVRAEKVKVVPVPIDTSFYHPINISDVILRRATSEYNIDKLSPTMKGILRASMSVSPQHTSFLFVGKWETRKGIRLLIRAFLSEFFHVTSPVIDEGSSAVQLYVLTSGYHSTEDVSLKLTRMLEEPEFKQMIEAYNTAHGILSPAVFPKIEVIKNVPKEEMPLLYSLMHAVVIPSLGEGWGRPHVEALACGTPVIATNWSGVTAYLTEQNGFPIAIEDELAESMDWKGHHWASPKVSSIQAHLRFVHGNHAEARRRGMQGRVDMIHKYSLEAVGAILALHQHRIELLIAGKDNPHVNEHHEL